MSSAHAEPNARAPRATVIAPGNYDGVHLGHRALLRTARAHAAAHGLSTCVLTFDPHPAALLSPARAPATLTLPDRRAELLRAAGVDQVILQPFTRELSRCSPAAFVDSLVQRGGRAFVVGPDFRFGRAREGDVTLLRALGQRHGFAVLVEPPVCLDGERVSSSAVRQTLHAGDVGLAARLLCRVHELAGTVVEGQRRGRTIGFPTANLHADAVLSPKDGVYAIVARVLGDEGPRLHGVANLGTRPTLAAGRSVEAHLFDFAQDLYGKRLRIGFVARVRDESKFAGLPELRAQIARDCEAARRTLGSVSEELLSWI